MDNHPNDTSSDSNNNSSPPKLPPLPLKKQPLSPKFGTPKLNNIGSINSGSTQPPPIPNRPPNFYKPPPDNGNSLSIEPKVPPVPPKRSNLQILERRAPVRNFDTDVETLSQVNPKFQRNSYNGPSRPLPQLPKTRHSDVYPISEADGDFESDSYSETGISKTSDSESFDNDSEYTIRTKIVNEILSTEKTYVNCLITLTTIWSDPIKNQNPNDPILPPEAAKYLFSNLEVILNINKQFLSDFENKMKEWSPTQCVAEVFLTSVPFFKVYKHYINNYSKSIELYQDNIKKKNFKKYVEECSKLSVPHDSLPSYLITPVQRIPRYQLLLTELCKYTPNTHPDYENLILALEKIKSVAVEINDNKREAESIYQCSEIQNMIVYPEETLQNNLVTPTRRYVRSGDYDIFLNNIKSVYNHLVLFNDGLLISKKKKKNIHYYGFIYIHRLKVESDDKGITLTPLCISNCLLYITISSDDEKKLWIEGLTKKFPEIPSVEDDELIMPNQTESKSDAPENGFKKKSLRKRFLTLTKNKGKSEIDHSKKSRDDDDIVKMNPKFNNELAKKLEGRNTQKNS